MPQLQHIPTLLRKSSCLLFSFICLFGLSQIVFAQSAMLWIYISRSEHGRYYVKRKIDRMDNGHRGIWMKLLAEDGSEEISYEEWDCQKRRFRIKQISYYAPDGTALRHLMDLDWAFATPESVAARLYEEACGTPREIKYAEIIVPKAQMRDSPNIRGEIYRTAKKEEIFPITPFDPVAAWYCVYDPQTLVEYWLHGNAIKIVPGKTENAKTKQPVTRSKTSRVGKSGKQN
jgi:hypothetical protein